MFSMLKADAIVEVALHNWKKFYILSAMLSCKI